MQLSNRLKTVADMAAEAAEKSIEQMNTWTIADIGTDHAYIPIYLCQNKNICMAIACDANAGPLEKAKENVKAAGLEDKIEHRLGAGLMPLKAAEVDVVVISGMGGRLMREILSFDKEKTKSFKAFVLQPQSEIEELRRYLHLINFRIQDEQMIQDGGKFYVVMIAVQGKDERYSESDYIFGKILIDRKDEVLHDYLTEELEKQERLLQSLMTAGTTAANNKAREVQMAQIRIRSVVKKLLG